MPTLHSFKGRKPDPRPSKSRPKRHSSPSKKSLNSSPPEILAVGAVLDHLARGGRLKDAGAVFRKEIKDKHDPFLKQSYGHMENRHNVASTAARAAATAFTASVKRRRRGKPSKKQLPKHLHRQVQGHDDDGDDDDEDEYETLHKNSEDSSDGGDDDGEDENESGWDDEDDDDDDANEDEDDADICEQESSNSSTSETFYRESESAGRSALCRTNDDGDESTIFFHDGEDDATALSRRTLDESVLQGTSMPTMQTNLSAHTDTRTEYTEDDGDVDVDNDSELEQPTAYDDQTDEDIMSSESCSYFEDHTTRRSINQKGKEMEAREMKSRERKEENGVVVASSVINGEIKQLASAPNNRSDRAVEVDQSKIKKMEASSVAYTRSHPLSDDNQMGHIDGATRSLDNPTQSANYEKNKTFSQLRQTVDSGKEVHIQIVQASTKVCDAGEESVLSAESGSREKGHSLESSKEAETTPQRIRDGGVPVFPQHALADDMNTIFTSASIVDRSVVCAFIAAIEGNRAIEAAKPQGKVSATDEDEASKGNGGTALSSRSTEGEKGVKSDSITSSSGHTAESNSHKEELMRLGKGEHSQSSNLSSSGKRFSMVSSLKKDRSGIKSSGRSQEQEQSEEVGTGTEPEPCERDDTDGLTLFGHETKLDDNKPESSVRSIDDAPKKSKKPISIKKAVRFLFRNKTKSFKTSDLPISASSGSFIHPNISKGTSAIVEESSEKEDQPMINPSPPTKEEAPDETTMSILGAKSEEVTLMKVETESHTASNEEIQEANLGPEMPYTSKEHSDVCLEHKDAIPEQFSLTQKVTPWSSLFGLVSPSRKTRSFDQSRSRSYTSSHMVDNFPKNGDDEEDQIIAKANCSLADQLVWSGFFGHHKEDEAEETGQDDMDDISPDDGIGIELVMTDGEIGSKESAEIESDDNFPLLTPPVKTEWESFFDRAFKNMTVFDFGSNKGQEASSMNSAPKDVQDAVNGNPEKSGVVDADHLPKDFLAKDDVPADDIPSDDVPTTDILTDDITSTDGAVTDECPFSDVLPTVDGKESQKADLSASSIKRPPTEKEERRDDGACQEAADEGMEWTAAQAGLQSGLSMSKTSWTDADVDTVCLDARETTIADDVPNSDNNSITSMRSPVSVKTIKFLGSRKSKSSAPRKTFWGLRKNSKQHPKQEVEIDQQGQQPEQDEEGPMVPGSLLHDIDYVVEVGKDRIRHSE